MSHQPKVIPDPYEFARRGDTLTGEVELAAFPRLLSEVRKGGAGQHVAYTLHGYQLDAKSFVDIQATAELVMTCRRCMGDVPCTVEADSRLMLVPPGEALPDDGLEDDDFDPMHVWRDFDVLAAVEEEVLLALPLAPTHDDCKMPVARGNGDESSPFAVLRGLKTPGASNT
jgi:uncharacterized protein